MTKLIEHLTLDEDSGSLHMAPGPLQKRLTKSAGSFTTTKSPWTLLFKYTNYIIDCSDLQVKCLLSASLMCHVVSVQDLVLKNKVLFV